MRHFNTVSKAHVDKYIKPYIWPFSCTNPEFIDIFLSEFIYTPNVQLL